TCGPPSHSVPFSVRDPWGCVERLSVLHPRMDRHREQRTMNGNHERSTELGTVRISATHRPRGTYGGPPPGSFNYVAAREHHLRLEERRAERARLTLQLHDTLFQGFLGASMLLHDAAEQVPTNSVIKSKMDRALQLVHLALDEGRAVLRGLQLARTASTSLEQALSELSDDFASAGHPRARVFACGRPRVLNPAIREQIYLIAREALLNAVRHSDATSVEVEVEYLPSKLRVIVRDNGK